MSHTSRACAIDMKVIVRVPRLEAKSRDLRQQSVLILVSKIDTGFDRSKVDIVINRSKVDTDVHRLRFGIEVDG